MSSENGGRGAQAQGQPHRSRKINVRALSRQFSTRQGPVEALRSINLEIDDGEFVCIVGPSGCGKTTLLRILAGLEAHDDGEVTIDAAARGAKDPPVHAMVFQEQSIFPWMSVRDNVAFGLQARGMRKRERYQAVQPHIERVGLAGFEQALPHQLSGGMRQRVSIARAFATDPEVLFMDEPFAALDEQTKLVLQEQLLEVWESNRKTVVYVTHSIDEAIILADRIVVMTARPGRVKDIVEVAPMFPHPRHVDSVKASEHFGKLFARVWDGLRHEIAGRPAAPGDR